MPGPHQRGARLLRRAQLQRGRARRSTPAPRSASARCASAKEVTYTFVERRAPRARRADPRAATCTSAATRRTPPPTADYRTFMNRVQPLVGAVGKTVIGWHQIGQADHTRPAASRSTGARPPPTPTAAPRSRKGDKVLLSPANKAYLDMKYTDAHPARPRLGRPDRGADAPTTGTRAPTSPACRPRPSSASRRRCGPRRSARSPTSSSWRSRGCPAIAELGWSPQSRTQLGHVQGAAGRAGAALDGAGDQLLPLAAGAVGHPAVGPALVATTTTTTTVTVYVHGRHGQPSYFAADFTLILV